MKSDIIKYIRKLNQKPSAQSRLLAQFISHGASTIPEIAKAVGVSLPTATSALNELIKAGIVKEIGKKDNSPGRIPMVYDLIPTAGYFVGVNPESGKTWRNHQRIHCNSSFSQRRNFTGMCKPGGTRQSFRRKSLQHVHLPERIANR